MFGEWLDTLLSGALDTNLTKMTLASIADGEFHGSGRVSWRFGEPITVRATTDGAGALRESLGVVRWQPGELVSHDHYMTASARDQHGWHITTRPELRASSSLHSNSPHVNWGSRSRC